MDNCKYCALTDLDRVQDMIVGEKYLMNVYSSFIPEATDDKLKCVLTDNFTGCSNDQTALFDSMNRLGWYELKNAPKPEIDAARQKFADLKKHISAQATGI